MTDAVDRTLQLWRRTDFAYGGERDCLQSLSVYVASCGGIDALARFRGTYDDQEGAQRHIDAYGGVIGLMGLFGLPEADEPLRGDILAVQPADEVIGALCTGARVAMRLPRGVIEVDRRFVPVIKAWRITGI